MSGADCSFEIQLVIFVSTRTDISRAIAKHYLCRELVDTGEQSILLDEDDELIRTAVCDTLRKR